MLVTKLDAYDYTIAPWSITSSQFRIRISISGVCDPILVDILSEISQSDGVVYVEGMYFRYVGDYTICANGDDSYLELRVEKTK